MKIAKAFTAKIEKLKKELKAKRFCIVSQEKECKILQVKMMIIKFSLPGFETGSFRSSVWHSPKLNYRSQHIERSVHNLIKC